MASKVEKEVENAEIKELHQIDLEREIKLKWGEARQSLTKAKKSRFSSLLKMFLSPTVEKRRN